MTRALKHAFLRALIAGAFLNACSGGATSKSADPSSPASDGGEFAAPGADAGKLNDAGSPPVADSGGSDATATDSGAVACSPTNQAAFVPAAYVHAVKHAGKCTMEQIAAYESACLREASTAATCTTFTGAAANTVCFGCLMPPASAPTPGPIVVAADEQSIEFNAAGCIELVDPTKGPACAPAYAADVECVRGACSGCARTDMAAEKAAQACEHAALIGTCSRYSAKLSSACASDFVDGGAAFTCDPKPGAEMIAALAVFCGT